MIVKQGSWNYHKIQSPSQERMIAIAIFILIETPPHVEYVPIIFPICVSTHSKYALGSATNTFLNLPSKIRLFLSRSSSSSFKFITPGSLIVVPRPCKIYFESSFVLFIRFAVSVKVMLVFIILPPPFMLHWSPQNVGLMFVPDWVVDCTLIRYLLSWTESACSFDSELKTRYLIGIFGMFPS